MNKHIFGKLFFAVVVLVGTLTCSGLIFAQTKSEVIPPPSEEKFKQVGDTVTTYRMASCLNSDSQELFEGKLCHMGTIDDLDMRQFAALYNQDGSVWLVFNVYSNHPESLERKPKKGFLPLSTAINKSLVEPVLRAVGESKHWFEVEVNENTRETKFISKDDSGWSRASWFYWLTYYTNITVDINRTPVLDKPDGKVVEQSLQKQIWKLLPVKIEGDWVYITGSARGGIGFNGWIRWRKGRNILVGTFLTFSQVPETEN